MSVAVAVLRGQEDPIGGFENVIGYVIAAVVKQPDGGVSLERSIAVYADNFEDNQLAEETVKAIEKKLNEAFPDPNKPQTPKLWVPGR